MSYTEAFRQAELARIDRRVAEGPYDADWDSLSRWQAPQWYRDAKFGIFTHWGIYTVPEHDNEWYSRNMYIEGSEAYRHHRETYGPQKDFGYKDLIPLFTAPRFDPAEWINAFRDAGARYYVPVAEHHDGFQMYDSALSDFNAAKMGPRRNVLGELHRAARDAGIIPCASSHRAEHWWFMSHGREFESDVRDPMRQGDFYWPAMPERGAWELDSEPAPNAEYLDDWLLRTVELIDRYQPRLLYFDWWIQHDAFRPWLKRLAAYYYNTAAREGYEPVIAYKHDAFVFGSALPDVERGQLADIQADPWQTDTACALNSWCYTKGNQYRDAPGIVCDLIDIVSKNGNLLLNIGPRADGRIGDEERDILRRIGAFLRVNGEAVYGTRPWRVYGEGPTKVKGGFFTDGEKKAFTSGDFRFTRKGAAIYITALKPSDDGGYCVRIFRSAKEPAFDTLYHPIQRVTRLDGTPVQWTRTEAGLLLKTAPGGDMPVVFKAIQA